MPTSKKPKSCYYPCPADCAETARYLADQPTLSSVEEAGIEGYDLVYVSDVHNKQVFVFGTPKKTGLQIEIDPIQPVHEQAYQKASEGEVVSYEWSACNRGKNCFFQSTLIPLRDQKGNIGSILGLVKNITDWAYAYHHTGFLKEVGHRTFPQVLLMAREEERRKLSSALHDEIGSTAVILTSLLSMVKESVRTQDHTRTMSDIAALDKQIKASVERIKNIVVSMRPPNLEAVALSDAMRDMVENVTRYHAITPTFEFENEDDIMISDEVKIVLYRVAQESLSNILKHAQASRVHIYLKRGVSEVILRITDNGQGFKQNKQRSIEHIGLLSMRDSVAYLGGRFTVKSELGKGTVIEAKCPKIVYGEINR